MTFSFAIPTPTGPKTFNLDGGSTILFVGANGGGKTRLAVQIEEVLGDKAHRISAHRALNLNPSVPKLSAIASLQSLRLGTSYEGIQSNQRAGVRWGSKAATYLLNDYDFLLQALFADQSNTSLITHQNVRAGNNEIPVATKFEQLQEVWNRILPHRILSISGDDIQVSIPGSIIKYSASEMSDGERAVFYLIGQTLVAANDSVIIFDEPELHVHRAIISRLWDEIIALRPDCGFIIISHDLEFVAARKGEKFVLVDYKPTPAWVIEGVPDDTGFSEELSTLILGSRKPVLFVEGRETSLDQAIFRACYPTWTIVPRGSCEEVIHAVTTMRANAMLTRITCAGIVDTDAYDGDDTALLELKGIATLPVSEIENLFLLPTVVEAIARTEGYEGEELANKVDQIKNDLLEDAGKPNNYLPVIMRFCKRRIDRVLKKVDLSDSQDVDALADDYVSKTSELDVKQFARLAEDNILNSIAEKNIEGLLKWYDNKGILAIASRAKNTSKAQFEQWIVRTLRNETAPGFTAAIRGVLPEIVPQ